MKKQLGYIIAIIGVFGIAASTIAEVNSLIPELSTLGNTTLIIASIAMIALGIFIIMTSSSSATSKRKEVPIYRGKTIVGYRRH